MTSFKVDGFDELENELNQLQKKANELEETNDVPFSELFSASFMKECSSFSSIYELLEAGGFKAESEEEFESIPEYELDKHIAAATKFNSWEDMLGEAVSQYTFKKLGF